ncbi:hypothetical protein [Dongia sp.]|uniref:hypothetical protein n=1 Tax=Dongia sp. TaxID=1977262 RepID=UPI0035B29936
MTVRFERLAGLAAFGILAITVWAEPAAAAACGGTIAPPVVSVRTDARPATQDHSRGIANLSGDPRLAVPHGLRDFRYAVGVTAAEADGKSKWEMRGEALPDGRQCWWITQLQIVITVSTKVFIAKEVPRGSCLWNEVVKHEAKHVRTDQKLFPQMAGLIRPKVLRAVSHSIATKSQAEARTVLGNLINKATAAAVADFQKTRNAMQLKIDTREEYSRPNRVCGEAEVTAAIQRAGLL